MGINWGRMKWEPFRRPHQEFSLEHIHPFFLDIHLDAASGRPAQDVVLLVGFGLHCFTRKISASDCVSLRYSDDREDRTFDEDRWKLSFGLRSIVESLPKRKKLGFAKNDNFVYVDVGEVAYGVFFNMKRVGHAATNQVLLIVQSAYALDRLKPNPAEGAIGFNAILGHVLRGTKPRRP